MRTEEERGLVEAARDEATCVALWAHQELARTSSAVWRWPRRRFLDRLWKRKCKEVDELASALKALDRDVEAKRKEIRDAADAHLPGAGAMLP